MTDSDGMDEADLIRRRDRDATMPAAAAGLLADWDRQDAALKALYGNVAEEPLPEPMRAALDRAETAPHRARRPMLQLAAALVLLALGAGGGYLAGRGAGAATGPMSLAREAMLAHATYAVEVRHPVEVPASDEAHLVAWLSKRLGHALKPPDFAAHGFHLIGGRVLPESHGAAAQLMYEDAVGRRVTFYVAREPGRSETAFRYTETGQAQGFWWIDEGLGCAVIGDLPREDLRAIAVAAYDQIL